MPTTPPVTTRNTVPMTVRQKRNFKEEANVIQVMINRYDTDAFLSEHSVDNEKLQNAHKTYAEIAELAMLRKTVGLSKDSEKSITPFITIKTDQERHQIFNNLEDNLEKIIESYINLKEIKEKYDSIKKNTPKIKDKFDFHTWELQDEETTAEVRKLIESNKQSEKKIAELAKKLEQYYVDVLLQPFPQGDLQPIPVPPALLG